MRCTLCLSVWLNTPDCTEDAPLPPLTLVPNRANCVARHKEEPLKEALAERETKVVGAEDGCPNSASGISSNLHLELSADLCPVLV